MTENMKKGFFFTSIVLLVLVAFLEATANDKSVGDILALKQTSLNLRLLGTITGGETKEIYAVIEDQEKEQALFQVGQSIQGAKIKEIFRYKVILNYKGENQVLVMNVLSAQSEDSDVTGETNINQLISNDFLSAQSEDPDVTEETNINQLISNDFLSAQSEDPAVTEETNINQLISNDFLSAQSEDSAVTEETNINQLISNDFLSAQ